MKDAFKNPISVVGNAESIFLNEYGHLIDLNPTIRFNRAEINDPLCQGTRWDYLASSEINTFEKYNKQVPEFHTLIFTPTKKEMEYKVKKVQFTTKVFKLPLFESQYLTNTIGEPPSTGLQILYYLHNLKNKNVSIFGFDFKETKTFYENRNKGRHDYAKEKMFIMDLVSQNGWNFY